MLQACQLTSSRANAFTDTRLYVSTGDVNGNDVTPSASVTFDARPSRADLVANNRDILFARMQATEKVVLVTDERSNYIWSTGFAALRPKQGINSRWVLYWLQSQAFQERKNALCTGATQKAITNDAIRELSIPIPPLSEQERLVQILDEAEELRRLRAEADRRAADLIPALFHEMFGDLGAIEKKCKLVRLEEVATRITDGVHLKPNYTASGIPFISVKDVTTGRLKFDDCKFISREDHGRFTKRCKPEYLDILYTKVGATYGRPAIIDTAREFSIYVSVCLIKPDKRLIEPQYLNAVLGTPAVKRQADQTIKGIGVPDLHLDQIRTFLIPLPPILLQRQFVAHCTEIGSLVDGQADSRQSLYDLFQSLLHRAFQGEL